MLAWKSTPAKNKLFEYIEYIVIFSIKVPTIQVFNNFDQTVSEMTGIGDMTYQSAASHAASPPQK